MLLSYDIIDTMRDIQEGQVDKPRPPKVSENFDKSLSSILYNAILTKTLSPTPLATPPNFDRLYHS